MTASQLDAISDGDGQAIELRGVNKEYRLYGSRVDQALDVTGLARWMFWRKPEFRLFRALQGIDLRIAHGERVGVIGRNGAGKTTLLKLVSGNFTPSQGTVQVNGSVQALMQVGMGFHDEFSGRENIHASLQYSGLSESARDVAVRDIVDFVELGEFLDQPIKTYSLGMRARLQFAAATAVQPDILIIDEVLGAGDAYFAGKSSMRMKKLTSSGCTLLLVSHAMDQVLQFCSRAIWIEEGRIAMDGPAIDVVRAYEEFTFEMRARDLNGANASQKAEPATTQSKTAALSRGANWQREGDASLLGLHGANDTQTPARDGISRWQGLGGLEISAVSVRSAGEPVNVVVEGEDLEIAIEAVAQADGDYPYQFVVLLFTEDGRPLTRHVSAHERANLRTGARIEARMRYDTVLLGVGRYVFSVAIYRDGVPRERASAAWYDLLSRSFQFEVTGPDEGDPSLFRHPATWKLQSPESAEV